MNENIYFDKIIKKKLLMNFNEIDKDINTTLLNKIKNKYENKCIEEGFIKKDTIEILERSNGYINQTNLLNNIVFNILFKCKMCNPKKNMICKCKIVEVIKPGFIAEFYPLSIIVPLNLHNNKSLFKKYKENDIITIKILDSKFIKNENEIQVVGLLTDDSAKKVIKINNDDDNINTNLNVDKINIEPIDNDENNSETNSIISNNDSDDINSLDDVNSLSETENYDDLETNDSLNEFDESNISNDDNTTEKDSVIE